MPSTASCGVALRHRSRPSLRALGPVAGGDKRVHQRVLGRQHHEGRAEQGVRAGREDLDRRRPSIRRRRRPGRRPGRPWLRPIQLRCMSLDLLGPVHAVQVVGQPVGVGGDPHHPLAQVALEDREVAALGAAVVGDLLVGQHRAQARAPVDRRLGGVGQAVAVEDVRRARRRSSVGPAAAVVGGQRALARAVLLDELADRPGPARAAVGPHGVRSYQELKICRKIHWVQR